MRIKGLSLHDFRGVRGVDVRFPGDFSCLIGGNGCGKTTILDAISLCCGSLDFDGIDVASDEEWNPSITPKQRREQFLRKNVRNFWEPGNKAGFRVEADFEHDGEPLKVVVTDKGFERNDIISKPWWWAGLCYVARFDSDMVNFQLRHDRWEAFAKAYEGVTGIPVEPEVMVDTDLASWGEDGRIVTGFYLVKEDGKVYSRYASSGEKKVAKTLSQVVNLEDDRLPHVVLVDEIERHVHYKRHLRMLEELKGIFAGMQVVATTHSTMVMERYEPREHLLDVEELRHAAKA